MNAHSPLQPQTDARPLLERQLSLLGELAEIGLDVARELGRQAKAQPDPAALQHIAMAYSRVSRAVRLTLLLQSKLAKDLEEAADAEAEDAELFEPGYRHKFRVERVVERLIKAEHDDEDKIDRLAIEAGERLDDEDLYGDVLDKPIGELVALICKDLGLHPDWSRLAEEAWAQAEIASGAEGSPFLPSPSRGEGPGMGVNAPGIQELEREAARLQHQTFEDSESTPIPTFPPRGGRGPP
jgi:hypothetical protein